MRWSHARLTPAALADVARRRARQDKRVKDVMTPMDKVTPRAGSRRAGPRSAVTSRACVA